MNEVAKTTLENQNTEINWRHITLFSGLAYLFSWAYWLPPLWPQIGELLRNGRTPENITEVAGAYFVLGMFGPMLAALVMRLFVSREGLRGSVGFKRKPRFYLIAWLAPALFVLILILFNHVAGIGRFSPEGQPPLWQSLPQMLFIGVAITTVLAFGEEYGWRGYLLPRLLPLGEVKGTLVLGLIWAFWHLPPLIAGLNYPGVHPVLAIAVFCFTVILLSFPFTWLHLSAGGSVLLAAILHASFNTFVDSYTSVSYIPEGNVLLTNGVGLVSGGMLLIMVLLVYFVFKRNRGVERHKVSASASALRESVS